MAIHLSYNNNWSLNMFDGNGLITIREIKIESGLILQKLVNLTIFRRYKLTM